MTVQVSLGSCITQSELLPQDVLRAPLCLPVFSSVDAGQLAR